MSKNIVYFCVLSGLIFPSIASEKPFDDVETGIQPQGKIIFVTGSCSSGKSSISKVLAEKLDAKYFAFDEYVMPIVLKKFINKHYGKFVGFFVSGFATRNFFSAVNLLSDKKKYEFQKKFYADLKDGLADQPTTKMYRAVKNVAMSGRNVVVESPLHLWDGVDFVHNLVEFEGVDVTYVLAYCPWDDLIQRIKQRNMSSNKKNRRELDWVVINYMHCFDVLPECRDNSFLENLNGRGVHEVITEHSQKIYKKKHLRLLTETQKVALKTFPQEIDYFIYPRFNYDITINTKANTPEMGAENIISHLCKKDSNFEKASINLAKNTTQK